jgi:acyl carrier protein
MALQQELVAVLDDVLNLNGRAAEMDRDSELLGALPELDSMSVMALIAALEERFSFTVHPEELDSASFATLGALSDFVETKLSAAAVS